MPDAHSSHQTGLDADIWFWLQPKSQPMDKSERETAQPPSMVANGRLALDPQRWTARQMRLMEAAAGFDSVARIFVTPPVKQALCKAFPGATWLRKLRPWWGHQAHFHVRLQCPTGEPSCVNQPPPSTGDGCDATLAWWFTDEARQPPRGKSKRPPLPKACQVMLAKSGKSLAAFFGAAAAGRLIVACRVPVIIIVVALVLARIQSGMIDASATHSPLSPCTCPYWLTTAMGSEAGPILHVHEM